MRVSAMWSGTDDQCLEIFWNVLLGFLPQNLGLLIIHFVFIFVKD